MTKLNLQKTDFYNPASLDAASTFSSYNGVTKGSIVQSYIDNLSTICITDVDGTYLDTTEAVLGAQAKALAKAVKVNYELAYNYLEKHGLENALSGIMSTDDFFQKHYKTFDPVQAAKSGQMKVFADALSFTQSGVPTIAISNSSENATRAKLQALGIEDKFVGVHAAYLKNEAKPNLHLAEKAIKDLDELGWYKPNQQIIHVGDQEYDVAFGNNIKNIHPNTVSVLIDRGKQYQGSAKPDYVIKSFDDLNNL